MGPILIVGGLYTVVWGNAKETAETETASLAA
jgi:hypothetical protein